MRRAIPILVVVLALGGLGLCREARALVVGVGVDTDKSTASDNGAAEPARDATTDPGHAADPGERLVNPFDNSPRSNMPETLPEDVVRRPAEHYNHQHNSRRFEQLLDSGADTPAVTRAATRETATRDAAPPPSTATSSTTSSASSSLSASALWGSCSCAAARRRGLSAPPQG